MNYNKRSTRELYDDAVCRIENLRRKAAHIDGQITAWLDVKANLHEQMMAEKQEQEDLEAYQPQDPARDRLFQPKGPEDTDGQ